MTEQPRALGKPYDASAGMPEPTMAERMAAEDAAANAEASPGDPGDPGDPPPPRIEVSTEADSMRVLIRALRRGILPEVYVRQGKPVEISESTEAKIGKLARLGRHLAVREVEPSMLRRLLAHHAYVYKLKPVKSKHKGPDGKSIETVEFVEVETSPTVQTCRDVLSETRWDGMPPLAGVSTSPVLRPNGTLVQTPGYDKATGIYYSPSLDVGTIPDRPSEELVTEARTFVLDTVLGDFPWVDKADKANYLALLVTPILRWFTGALTPLGAISAASAATGKTLLAGDIPAALYGLTSRPWVSSDEELRKSISTVLLSSTAPVVLFDNVPEWESVTSPILAKLLTSDQWDDRALGGNQAIEVANDRLWLTTGNAMSFGGDMPSRTVLVRLDAKTARPDLRTNFEIPDLQDWLKNPVNAAELLRALLIMVADWVAAGARTETYVKRQFTRWASAAGGFLAHHGVHGLLGNDSALDQADDEMTMWLGFCHEWHIRYDSAWKSTTEVAASAAQTFDPMTGGAHDPWRGRFLVDKNGRPVTAVGLGKRINAKLGRIFGSDADGYRIEVLYNTTNKTRQYRVIKASDIDRLADDVLAAEPAADVPAPAPAPRQGGLWHTESDDDD